MKLPATWSTSARLLVEAPQIPSNMVASTVQISAVEQLDIIQQKLLTRANLIDIANKFDVFEDTAAMGPDRVVREMQGATRIRRTTGRNQATLLVISFSARSGQIAAGVVNEYVTLALEENADIRVSRAETTLSFFQQEVDRLNQELSRQSAKIASFRSENLDALPEDQNYRQGRQALLQERLSRLERDLASAQQQRVDMVEIFEATGSVTTSTQAAPLSREEQQLATVSAELDRALQVYSEQHPIVVRLLARVVDLEAAVAAQLAIASQQTDLDTAQEPEAQQMTPERAMLQASLTEIDGRIKLLETGIVETTAALEQLQNAIGRSASIGIELATLDREYTNLQGRYNSAVNNLNSARMSERIETTAQGQRITVIENANVPRAPTGPNRSRIVMMGIATGFALACAYFVALELLNRTVRRPAELLSRFNVAPIAIIPYMENRRERILRRGGILLATVVALLGVPLTLWYIDTNYLPLELVVQRGLARLGLG